jgi:hypothetical protein
MTSFILQSFERLSAETDDSADAEQDEDLSEDQRDAVDVDEIKDEELPFPPDEIDDWELRHARRRGSEFSYRHQTNWCLGG